MKKRNEEDSDIQEDNGEKLSAEELKELNRLLERLHQADYKTLGSIVLNVYKPGSWHVDNVENQNFFGEKLSGTPMAMLHKASPTVPPPEAMVEAVEKTIESGHWWANLCWSVVYRIYQMKGYKGSISQFVREVAGWPFFKPVKWECNDDAVGKPVRSGKISRELDKWTDDGAPMQFYILGEALLKILATQGY